MLFILHIGLYVCGQVCPYTSWVLADWGDQQSTRNPLGLELWTATWALMLGLLKGQPVSLTAEPSLQPCILSIVLRAFKRPCYLSVCLSVCLAIKRVFVFALTCHSTRLEVRGQLVEVGFLFLQWVPGIKLRLLGLTASTSAVESSCQLFFFF